MGSGNLAVRLTALSALALVGALVFAAQSHATSYSVTVTLDGSGAGTVIGGGGTISCPNDCSEDNYPAGPLSLTAAPNAYSLFGGWTGACALSGSSPSCVTTVNGDTVIGATFTAVPTGPISTTPPPHKKKCKKKKHRAAAAKKCKKKKKRH
jgi:Divergent InlB B-repeat domain